MARVPWKTRHLSLRRASPQTPPQSRWKMPGAKILDGRSAPLLVSKLLCQNGLDMRFAPQGKLSNQGLLILITL